MSMTTKDLDVISSNSDYWKDCLVHKIKYLNSVSDEIIACYITLTEFIGDINYPFPPDNRSLRYILQTINVENNGTSKSTKKKLMPLVDFLEEQSKRVGEILNNPISLNKNYFEELLECARFIICYFDIIAIINKMHRSLIDRIKESPQGFYNLEHEIKDAIYKTIDLANPIRHYSAIKNLDYQLIARFNEAKGVWTEKVTASRRGRKVAAVRTKKRLENVQIIKDILAKYDYKIDNAAIIEAMTKTDRGEKTIKNYISEIMGETEKTM